MLIPEPDPEAEPKLLVLLKKKKKIQLLEGGKKTPDVKSVFITTF